LIVAAGAITRTFHIIPLRSLGPRVRGDDP